MKKPSVATHTATQKMTTQGPFRKNVGQIDINILRGFFDIVDELIS